MKTKVVFRRFHDGEILAIFPEIPADTQGCFCLSYAHVGQHGAAAIYPCGSRPATPEQAAPLAAELTRIGYELEPVKRVSFAMHRARGNAARRVTH